MPVTTESEPLIVECACPGDGGTICELTAIRIDYTAYMNEWVTASLLSLELGCGVVFTGIGGNSSGSISVDLSCNHTSGPLFYYFGRAISSDEVGGAYIHYLVNATYTCLTDSGIEFRTVPYNLRGPAVIVYCEGATGRDSETILSGVSANGGQIRSRPLGCTDDASQTITVELEVDDTRSFEKGTGACFCATGGTTITDGDDVFPPHYAFAIISGRLAEGLTLNGASGCIEGDKIPGGDPGTDRLTVRVTETNSGESATVDCGFLLPGCEAGAVENYFR